MFYYCNRTFTKIVQLPYLNMFTRNIQCLVFVFVCVGGWRVEGGGRGGGGGGGGGGGCRGGGGVGEGGGRGRGGRGLVNFEGKIEIEITQGWGQNRY